MAVGKDEKYTYDDLNRLVKSERGTLSGGNITSNKARTEEWVLSQTGNWSTYKFNHNPASDSTYTDADDLLQTRTHNAANEIWNSTPADAITEETNQTHWASPVYDAAGNMTTLPRPLPGDPASTYACSYDAWSRLVKVSAGETTIAEYRYDGLGRQIRKFTPAEGSYWHVREYYYNNAWQTLETAKTDLGTRTGGAEPAVAGTLYEQYVWSPRYIDAPILRDRDKDAGGDLSFTGSGLDERLYYLTDANMNVTALVDNTSGTVVERCVYDPYGNAKFYDGSWGSASDTSAKANEILFCGYHYDPDTGLYHVRHRVYHPGLGRWLQRDPIGYRDGMSLYQYVRSAPLGMVDPQGLGVAETNPISNENYGYGQVLVAHVQGIVAFGAKRAEARYNDDIAESDRLFAPCCITVRKVGLANWSKDLTEAMLGDDLTLDMGDVGLAVDAAAAGHRDDAPGEGLFDGVVHGHRQPSDLLDEELAASGGALVVGQGGGDPPVGQQVNGEGLAAQGGHRVEAPADVFEGGVGGLGLADVPQVPADSVCPRGGQVPQQLLEHVVRPALVGGEAERHARGLEADNLDRHGPDVDSDVGHEALTVPVPVGRRLATRGPCERVRQIRRPMRPRPHRWQAGASRAPPLF
ncbi:MAG: RHS repeat-associated core domain-containing protein [Planctomycetota bacterium]|nr:RHS repeat-associated core domain-containing protein [Planctomycetota bacterium]